MTITFFSASDCSHIENVLVISPEQSLVLLILIALFKIPIISCQNWLLLLKSLALEHTLPRIKSTAKSIEGKVVISPSLNRKLSISKLKSPFFITLR